MEGAEPPRLFLLFLRKKVPRYLCPVGRQQRVKRHRIHQIGTPVSFNLIRYWVIVPLPSNRTRFSDIKLSTEFTLHPANLRMEFHVTANTILFTVKRVQAAGNGGKETTVTSIVSRLDRQRLQVHTAVSVLYHFLVISSNALGCYQGPWVRLHKTFHFCFSTMTMTVCPRLTALVEGRIFQQLSRASQLTSL